MDRKTTREDVYWLYRCVLGREPEDDGVVACYLGKNFDEVRNDFLKSQELYIQISEKKVQVKPIFRFLAHQKNHFVSFSNPEIGRPTLSFFGSNSDRTARETCLRLLYCYPIFEAAAAAKVLPELLCNVGDDSQSGVISFCNKAKDAVGLIPDPFFMDQRGYQLHREHFRRQPAWSERSDVPFWRGSSTGHRSEYPNILDLPRARLCRFAKGRSMDFRLSNIVQASQEEEHLLADLVSGFSPWQGLVTKKYNIDIDGNTSSWPGLFIKLLSGGVVLKVESPWRQWYYDLLKPWVNYVPVSTDFADLEASLGRLQSDPVLAEGIALKGRDLALSMTFEEGIRCGVKNIISLAAASQSAVNDAASQ